MAMTESNSTQKYTDLTYLKEVANGSDTFIVQMLNIFIEQMPQSLTRINEAVKNKDWKSLRMVVHKIKPSIIFTGLKEITDDVPLLEEYAAEESHLDAIPGLADKIIKVCTGAIAELKEELKQLQ